MKNHRKNFYGIVLLASMFVAGAPAIAAEYRSLEGVTGLDVVFDFRLTDPQTADLFLRLIHETWLDQDVRGMEEPANFVILVNNGAIKLIASDQPGFSPDDQVYLESIADRIALMAKDGIRFEGCLKAAKLFGVDPDLFHSDINKINNAWISIAGYQAQDYANLAIN